jgi:hypothetical protein
MCFANSSQVLINLYTGGQQTSNSNGGGGLIWNPISAVTQTSPAQGTCSAVLDHTVYSYVYTMLGMDFSYYGHEWSNNQTTFHRMQGTSKLKLAVVKIY